MDAKIMTVDFYNGAVADTNQTLSSAASDKDHTGVGRGCREVWSGQCGATIRNGNNWWRDVCFTLSTATGDNVPCVMEIYE